MSQRTIKQWCKEHAINWHGQARLGSIRYDWKLSFDHGQSAIFSSRVTSAAPQVHDVNGRSVLLFPNLNPSRGNGKISESKFLGIVAWVQQCLAGTVCEFDYAEGTSRVR
jgi:hypothetical protein